MYNCYVKTSLKWQAFQIVAWHKHHRFPRESGQALGKRVPKTRWPKELVTWAGHHESWLLEQQRSERWERRPLGEWPFSWGWNRLLVCRLHLVAEALGVQVKEFPWMFHPLLPYQSPRNSSSSLIAILLGFETFVCAPAIPLEAVDSILPIFGSTTFGWSQ